MTYLEQVVKELKDKASRAYCDYIDQLKKDECLGWEQKIKSGKFGKDELLAHNNASRLLGKHQAYSDAAQSIDDIDRWVSVEDELPSGKESKEFLVSLYNEGHDTRQSKFYYCSGNFLANDIKRINKSVLIAATHWQHIIGARS